MLVSLLRRRGSTTASGLCEAAGHGASPCLATDGVPRDRDAISWTTLLQGADELMAAQVRAGGAGGFVAFCVRA